MTSEPDFELMVTILRKLQAGQAKLKDAIGHLSENVTGIRNQLHAMQGDGPAAGASDCEPARRR